MQSNLYAIIFVQKGRKCGLNDKSGFNQEEEQINNIQTLIEVTEVVFQLKIISVN